MYKRVARSAFYSLFYTISPDYMLCSYVYVVLALHNVSVVVVMTGRCLLTIHNPIAWALYHRYLLSPIGVLHSHHEH